MQFWERIALIMLNCTRLCLVQYSGLLVQLIPKYTASHAVICHEISNEEAPQIIHWKHTYD